MVLSSTYVVVGIISQFLFIAGKQEYQSWVFSVFSLGVL
jgi:hypothetical protein